jgi:hypothetical protein
VLDGLGTGLVASFVARDFQSAVQEQENPEHQPYDWGKRKNDREGG